MHRKTEEALFKMIFRIMKRKSEHTLPSDVAWEEVAMPLEVYLKI